MHAHVDESHRPGLYVLAAALLEEETLPLARTALEGLRVGRSDRLHWRNESPARRLVIASTVAGAVHAHEAGLTSDYRDLIEVEVVRA